MVEKEAIEIAIHCLGVQAEQEVCEECPAYNKGGIFCREAVRTAISALKEIQQYREIGTVEEIKDLLAMVSEAAEDVDESGISVGFIKDLIQLGEYRKIGTVEECREAREKQTPNKPKDGLYGHGYFACGSCKNPLDGDESYCPQCGQAIRWEN